MTDNNRQTAGNRARLLEIIDHTAEATPEQILAGYTAGTTKEVREAVKLAQDFLYNAGIAGYTEEDPGKLLYEDEEAAQLAEEYSETIEKL